jgi:phosphate starvation-inducible PhoH-like protein
LDEAQNSTVGQMKMLLTRLGERSKAVVTGDLTQIDLAHPTTSGLTLACQILKGIKGIGMVYLTENDVVRHKLVGAIIRAYERYEGRDDSARRNHDLQSPNGAPTHEDDEE